MIVKVTYTGIDCTTKVEQTIVKQFVLVSSTGAPGASAYQIAVANGFVGTEEEWLDSLKAVASLNDIEDVSITSPQNKQGLYFDSTASLWKNDWNWFQYASGFKHGTIPTEISNSGGVRLFSYEYTFGNRYRKIDLTQDAFYIEQACTTLIVKKEI